MIKIKYVSISPDVFVQYFQKSKNFASSIINFFYTKRYCNYLYFCVNKMIFFLIHHFFLFNSSLFLFWVVSLKKRNSLLGSDPLFLIAIQLGIFLPNRENGCRVTCNGKPCSNNLFTTKYQFCYYHYSFLVHQYASMLKFDDSKSHTTTSLTPSPYSPEVLQQMQNYVQQTCRPPKCKYPIYCEEVGVCLEHYQELLIKIEAVKKVTFFEFPFLLFCFNSL